MRIPVIISKKEKAAAMTACFKKLFVFSPFFTPKRDKIRNRRNERSQTRFVFYNKERDESYEKTVDFNYHGWFRVRRAHDGGNAIDAAKTQTSTGCFKIIP